MNDLIDRQDAIDAMEKSKKQYFDRKIIIGKMQDIINNLPPAQPHWIPCRERLPEKGVEVLSCTNDGFIRIAEYDCWDGEMEWTEVTEYRFISDVVAWLPLPGPYRHETK